MKPEVLAIIPARGGSKGLPRKNIKLLCGKPLIAYTIEAALNARFVDRSIVSTEDKEIAAVASEYGAEVIKRPQELALDTTLIQPVMEQVIETLEKDGSYKPEIIVLLNPTSPLRNSEHIDGALHTFLHGLADSLVSVYATRDICLWELTTETHYGRDRKGLGAPRGIYKANYDFLYKSQRQRLPIQYRENGSIYITKRDFLMKNHHYLGGRMVFYALPEANSIDINTSLDFIIAEAVMNANPAYQS